MRRLRGYQWIVLAVLFLLPQSTSANPSDRPELVYSCPTTSSISYAQGGMYQWDLDNPVRPAWNHADKNLGLRSYSLTSDTKDYVIYGSDDPEQPPQFATLFNPDRTPLFTNVFRANHWNWQSPPNPGTQGTPITSPPVTVLGLLTTPGEVLQAPTHARDLGSPFGTGGSAVIFADEDSITLKFTREDSAATGYTMHIDNICTDPNLLALYNSLDNTTRNTYSSPRDGSIDYNLPALPQGKTFGTARGTEIRVAIVDTGTFQDPRSRNEWWQIRTSVSDVPALATPLDGAILFESTPTFDWYDAAGSPVAYQIQIDNNSDFSSPEVDATPTPSEYTVSSALADGTYNWHVRARDASNNWTNWSSTYSFQILGGDSLMKNGSFEYFEPRQWWSYNTSTADGLVCNQSHAGSCSVTFVGDGQTKNVGTATFYTNAVSGPAGDDFTASVWYRASNVSGPGPFRIRVRFVYTDDSEETLNFNLPTGSYGWTQVSQTVTASQDYKQVKFWVQYGKPGGQVWFDDASLSRTSSPATGNLLYNSDYEQPEPNKWTANNNITHADGAACTNPVDGSCTVQIGGDGSAKRYFYKYKVGGLAGDEFTASIWNRATNATGGGPFQMEIQFFYTDATTESFVVPFNTGTHGWEEVTVSGTASKDYNEVRVVLFYKKSGGTAYFDLAYLTLN